jgi:RHO1 GDP-GTP exchange protein 1/2
LELLIISATDDATATMRGQNGRARSGMSTLSKAVTVPAVVVRADNGRNGYPITFQYLGWRGYIITLWAPTQIGRKKWLDHIQKQQETLKERSTMFETVSFSEGFFTGPNRVHCAAPFSEYFLGPEDQEADS